MTAIIHAYTYTLFCMFEREPDKGKKTIKDNAETFSEHMWVFPIYLLYALIFMQLNIFFIKRNKCD